MLDRETKYLNRLLNVINTVFMLLDVNEETILSDNHDFIAMFNQVIQKAISDIKEEEIIQVSRKEDRNRFFTSTTQLPPGNNTQENLIISPSKVCRSP